MNTNIIEINSNSNLIEQINKILNYFSKYNSSKKWLICNYECEQFKEQSLLIYSLFHYKYNNIYKCVYTEKDLLNELENDDYNILICNEIITDNIKTNIALYKTKLNNIFNIENDKEVLVIQLNKKQFDDNSLVDKYSSTFEKFLQEKNVYTL